MSASLEATLFEPEVAATADSRALQVAAPRRQLNPVQLRHRQEIIEKLVDGRYRLVHVPLCLCGHSGSREVVSWDRFGFPVSMVACLACGLLRTTPRFNEDVLPNFYEEDYHGLHMGTPSPEPGQALFRSGLGKLIYELTAPYLPASDELIAVEIGCGTGTVLREFTEAGRHAGVSVTTAGCEYSSSFAEEGRRLGTDVRLGDIGSVADVRTPDLIILSHVLEHFADPGAKLAQLREMCGPDTLLYVEVPGVLTIHRKAEYEYDPGLYFTLAHIHHFTLASLTWTLQDAGFELLRGDEEIRSLFRRGDGSATSTHPANVRGTLDYFTWLERSRWLQICRLMVGAKLWARSAIKDLVRAVAGEAAVHKLRKLRAVVSGIR